MAKKKVPLTPSQVALAKKIGECIEGYWKEMVENDVNDGGESYVEFIGLVYQAAGDNAADAVYHFESMIEDAGDSDMRCPK
jgi:hypothetical protein